MSIIACFGPFNENILHEITLELDKAKTFCDHKLQYDIGVLSFKFWNNITTRA